MLAAILGLVLYPSRLFGIPDCIAIVVIVCVSLYM